jgi:ribosomal protein S18 acetylase RimI-like enzyme
MRIRDATPDDWPQIWPFLREIVAAGETYCWPTDTAEDAAKAWWMAKPGGRVFVAIADETGTDAATEAGTDAATAAEDAATDGTVVGTVVGTAELHPNQLAAGSHVANAGFMVDPAYGGRGIGRALAAHVIEAARGDGYRAMQFNAVVETNSNAVRLWQSLGFEILATVPEAFTHPSLGFVGLHVMHRTLNRI